MEFKTCTKCGGVFPATTKFFYPSPQTKIGLTSRCRECLRAESRKYDHTHRKEQTARNREWRRKNPEDARAIYKRGRDSHKEARKAFRQVWRQRNREHVQEYTRAWLRNNPGVRLSANMGYMVWYALHNNKGGHTWEDIVGYTLTDLQQHLESLFQPGMSWDNYGEWHVDHIHPKSSFTFTSRDDPEFRKCWALDNLQPLWAADNLAKGAKPPNEREVFA